MSENKFEIVFFHSHSPFNFESVLLPLICENNCIPYVCWMHGAAGNNEILNSYKFSDQLFGQHYFVYGEEYKNLLTNHQSNSKLIAHTMGSPMLVDRYFDYKIPKNQIKIITIVTASCGNKNIHHLFDSPHYRFDYYYPLKSAIETVSKYTNKYRVIIRSHKNESQAAVLNNLLRMMNVEEIEIMDTDFAPFDEVVHFSDLFINFGISTTFYEECLSEADIFLFDDSNLTRESKKTLSNRAFWFDDLKHFSKNLDDYLGRGLFYQKGKDETFIQKYLDWDRKDHIAQNALDVIKDLTS